MIIYGTRTIQATRGQGDFQCPRCGVARPYRLVSADRYFTLYFIPLIPFGSAGRYVECGGCAGTFGEEVLQYDPEAERRELAADFRRGLVLVLLAAGRGDDRSVAHLQRVLFDQGQGNVDARLIQQDLQLARQAQADLTVFVQQRLSALNPSGQKRLFRAAAELLAAHGPLQFRDEQALQALARGLGMPWNVAQPLIAGP